MIKIIRKKQDTPVVVNEEDLISTTSIDVNYDGEGNPILLSPIKNLISITYDANGKPDKEKVSLGLKYDHRVTWLSFNLDQLLWGRSNNKIYTNNVDLYDLYNFKMVVRGPEGTATWGFDGHTFEINNFITKVAGDYEFILVIEEKTADEYAGNVDDNITDITPDIQERFIAKSFIGNVETSSFNPLSEIKITEFVTDQDRSLIKPIIHCTLTDKGNLTSSSAYIGQKYDNLIRFLSFDKGQLSANLNDFYLIVCYLQGEKYTFSALEKSDNYDETTKNEWVSWIPSEVFRTPGNVQMFIVGFLGDPNIVNKFDDPNSPYFFYVSNSVMLQVEDNFLTEDDLDADYGTNAITTNFTDYYGDVIYTADGEIFITQDGGNE